MKKNILIFTLFLLTFSFKSTAQLEELQPVTFSKSGEMERIADSIKANLRNLGYQLLREATLSMENQYEAPVIAALTRGSYYQVVFIADPTSRLNEVRMFDYDEKQVYYQRNYGDVQGNVINYGYLARFSEFHMIKPVQVNKKKKEILGHLMLFKKVETIN